MKNRSRTDVASQILEAANGGATRTKIMYTAFLSHAQLKEYLIFLTVNGLINYDSARKVYGTSPKGVSYLGLCSQIDEFNKTARQMK